MPIMWENNVMPHHADDAWSCSGKKTGEKQREEQRKAQSCHVWVQCGVLCAPTTSPHAPSKHMNIHKNIMITAGGDEKMCDGVQDCSQRGLLVQVQVKSPSLKTGGRGVPHVIGWSYRSLQLILVSPWAALGGHLCSHMLFSSWSNGVGGAWSTAFHLYSRLTGFLCSCSPSPSPSWQQLFCPRSAALCSMATTWQLSTLLQRLVPLHPSQHPQYYY